MKIERKKFSICLVFILLLGLYQGEVIGQNPIRVWLNGEFLEMETSPIIKNDRTIVPIRFIAENLGLEVKWNEKEASVSIGSDDLNQGILLKIGDRNLYSSKKEKIRTMDLAPEIINDRTMVPVRFIAEEFNIQVDWDPKNQVVILGDGYFTENNSKLPFDEPMKLILSSGAGGWATELVLEANGNFTGKYYDSDSGEIGLGYPYGIKYICNFKGEFKNIKKLAKDRYVLELKKIETKEQEGDSWIEDGVKYIASTPYGLEKGELFEFYTPNKDINNLSDDFLSWTRMLKDNKGPKKLGKYGLNNIEGGYGFFSYDND